MAIYNAEVTDAVKNVIRRHEATVGCLTGTEAYKAIGKISNVDPGEGSWNEGDVFTVPKDIKAALFVAKINGNNAPGVAVNTAAGEGKALYFSTLKKSVVPYEEDENGEFRIARDENGENMPAVTAGTDNAVRQAILRQPTIGAIADYVAGRSFKVVKVISGIQTSRLERQTGDNGQIKWKVVGLRKTSIPVFEDITPEMPVAEESKE